MLVATAVGGGGGGDHGAVDAVFVPRMVSLA